MNILEKKRSILIIDVFIFFICVAGLLQIVQRAGTGALLGHKQGTVVILSDRGNTGPLHSGDYIIGIDTLAVSTINEVDFILDHHQVGDLIKLHLQRGQNGITIHVKLQRYNSTQYIVTLLTVAPLFFILGIFVLIKRPEKDQSSLVFHWMCVLISLYICTSFGRVNLFPLPVSYGLRCIFLFASSAVPILFFYFSTLFPQNRSKTRMLAGLLIISAVFFCTSSFLLFRALFPFSKTDFALFSKVYNTSGWLFIFCLIYGVINFLRSFKRAQHEAERRKLRWIILGLAIAAIGFIFLWQVPRLLGNTALVRGEMVLIVISIIPITFSVSIVRYHAFNIDLFFNRSTVYILLITFLLIVYSIIVAVAAWLTSAFTIRASIIVSAAAAVVVALLFEPLRRIIQEFVDKKFFRVRYNYRITQREVNSEIANQISIESLADFVANKIEDLLKPESIGLWISGNSSKQNGCIIGRNINQLNSKTIDELERSIESSTNSFLAIPAYLEAGISVDILNINRIKNEPIALVIPLKSSDDQILGLLLLGPKKSGNTYAIEDIDLLKTVSSLAASSIVKIRLQSDLYIKEAENQRLEEINHLKSYFVSSVSHDLQTPLTSISMFTELLQNKKNLSEDEKQEYLSIIRGESERLSRLINNVLNFSKIEKGMKTYRLETVGVIEMISSVLKVMNYPVHQNEFELITKFPEEDFCVEADRDAISEAIMNLIDNAMKYSRDDKRIKLEVTPNQSEVRISITDFGIGISAQEQARIFDAFYRSDIEEVKARGGAGLGLTQVKHIVEAHNGKVEVQSSGEAGSTFSIILPIGES